jgi:hypothetical protein
LLFLEFGNFEQLLGLFAAAGNSKGEKAEAQGQRALPIASQRGFHLNYRLAMIHTA